MTEKPTYEELEKRIQKLEQTESNRKQIEEALRQSEEYLSITLNSIGDAVIATDVEGNVVQLNPVAEKLTGWKFSEAKGRSVIEVFNIISEKTRKRVESPIEQVMRKGVIAGLSNHTILISKEDVERPIEDNCAPIRNDQGEIMGVVLVFRDVTEKRRVKKELKESEENLRSIFENMKDVYYKLDANGKILMASPSGVALYNYDSLDEIIGKQANDFVYDIEDNEKFIKELQKKGYLKNYIIKHKCKNGKPIFVETNTTLIFDDQGNLEGAVGVFRDIAERKKAEEIKKALFAISNAVNVTRNLKDLFEIIHKALGNIIDVTNFFIAMVDIKKRTLYFPYHVDTNDYDFFPTTNFDTNDSLTGLVVSQRRPILLKKNDLEKLSAQKGVWGPVPLIWMGAPLIVKDEIIGVVAVQSYLDSNLYTEQDLQVLSGISDQMAIAIDRKQAEALLKESEEYLANIINTIGDPVFVKDEQFRFVLVNDALCTLLGKTRDELVGTTGMEFLPKDQMDHFLEVDRKVLSSGEDQLNEEPLTDGDSTIRTIVTKKTRYIGAQGAKFIVGVIRDITDRKLMNLALEEGQKKFSTLFETNPAGVVITDLNNGKIIDVNESIEKITGYNRHEIIGRISTEIGFWSHQNDRKKIVKLLEEDGSFRNQEFEYTDKQGAIKQGLFSAKVVILQDKPSIITAMFDVTEIKKIENELKISEHRFRDITLSMADWIWEVDRNGKYIYASDTVKNTLGFSCKELIGKTPFELMSVEEGTKIRKVFLEISSKSGPIVDLENWNLAKDGTIVCFLTNAVPILDDNGELQGYRGVDKDITVQKKLETEKASIEAQLRQAQKMESVGRLAGGVAHDYNNALTAIMGYTELAMMEADPNGPLHADLKEILKASRHAEDITRQLLAFARKQTIAPKVLDLNTNIESMLKMIRRLIGEDIDLVWFPGKNLWPVKMDPSQIDQILANLCVNAKDAIAGVGKITIETSVIVLDEAYCASHRGFVPGEFVLMAISDNGCGMDKETMDNIFEPFFTTKAVDKGTGLGLSTVYGIVKQNKGFINVYSKPGKGTTIKIYLPRNESKAVEIQRERTEQIPQGHGETILLVEDDRSILKLTQKILEGLNYTVFIVDTPKGALSLAKAHTGEIQMLITDVIMPEMNGLELANKLQAIYPSIKRMFMSGYTANAIAHHGVLDEGVHFVQKPFSQADLAKIVRKVLDENNN
jgi:two-component system, cell cycle sensor histidine kinase and response regulator CckA